MCDLREIKYARAIKYSDIKNLTIPGVYQIIATGSFYIYFDGNKSYKLGDEINE